MADDLRPEESDLVGRWLARGDRVEADAVAERIERLVAGHLQPLGAADGGWSRLYRDPRDGRLWEYTYPESHLHGGGPPRLRLLAPEDARAKYGADIA